MWYHVTPYYLGKTCIFTPKVPINDDTVREGNIPRICVTHSIFNCLKAVMGTHILYPTDMKNYQENPCVYGTEEIPFIPPECSDFRENDERWFLKKTKFFFLGRVDIYHLFRYNTVIPTKVKEIRFPKYHPGLATAKEEFIWRLLY